MIIHKIPKPISIIGEFSNKCISYSSCNFSYLSKLNNKNRFLIDKNDESFLIKYIKNYPVLKSNIIKMMNEENFFSSYCMCFGKLNFINCNKNSWFNVNMNYQNDFFENILIYHIKRKFFKHEIIKMKDDFNLTIANKMVDDAYKAYEEKDYKFIGKLVESYWKLKSQSEPNCANAYVYKIYSDCKLAGIWGGKIHNNTLILIAPKEKHEQIKLIMKENILLKSSVNLNGIISEEVFGGNSNCCK